MLDLQEKKQFVLGKKGLTEGGTLLWVKKRESRGKKGRAKKQKLRFSEEPSQSIVRGKEGKRGKLRGVSPEEISRLSMGASRGPQEKMLAEENFTSKVVRLKGSPHAKERHRVLEKGDTEPMMEFAR